MKDPRLTADELDVIVSVAYGGAAYRAGRRAQAQALGNLLRRKPVDGPNCAPGDQNRKV